MLTFPNPGFSFDGSRDSVFPSAVFTYYFDAKHWLAEGDSDGCNVTVAFRARNALLEETTVRRHRQGDEVDLCTRAEITRRCEVAEEHGDEYDLSRVHEVSEEFLADIIQDAKSRLTLIECLVQLNCMAVQ
jgi:hypothetical protein